MKKPFYKRGWFIALVVLILLGSVGGSKSGKSDTSTVQVTEMPAATEPVRSVASAEVEEAEATPKPSPTPRVYTYVVNTSTGKFHSPNCRAVSNMSDSHKLEIEATRDEIEEMGYDPCDICQK